MVALQELVRTRYLDTVRSTQPAKSRWKILVVDAFTKLHLNHVLKVYDILEEGVQRALTVLHSFNIAAHIAWTSYKRGRLDGVILMHSLYPAEIDQLEQGRARNPNMEALYIVLPTTDNVERICQDFYVPPAPKPNKRDKTPQLPFTPQPPRYGAAHICFIGGIPDQLFDKLAADIPEHQLRAVKELYVHFWAIESHVFSIKSPHAFHTFYAPPKRSAREAVDAAEDELRFTAQSLVNVLAILGEYPVIRYYKPNQKPIGVGLAYNEHITKRLAEMVQEGMDKYCRDNESFPPKPDPPRQRGALLITDRSMDLSAPLLHEFTYQAMINDVLDVEDEGKLYKHSFRNATGMLEEKDVILTEEDDIWAETRHMHMKDALDKLIADFKQYAGDYQQKFGGEGQSSINDMKDMLASLDATRKSKDSLSAHLSLAEKCMGFFEKNKLPAVADVEQCCATGVTSEGKAPRTLVEDMVPLLGERSLSSKDKIRIIALYILFRDGVPEEDRKRLFQHARLALHEMDMVNNLKFLGLDISKELKTSRKAPLRQRQQEDVYDISRYQPIIKLMLDDYCLDRLDTIAFPYIRDAPPTSVRSSAASAAAVGGGGSLRSSRPNWAERAKAKPVKEPRQRIVVFQLGGITYSEVRAAYQVSQASNRDVFIGSSHIITPKTFLQDLSNMDRGGAATMGSAAAPDVARYDKYREMSKNDKTPRPTAQEGFDNRFPFVAASRPSAERGSSAAQVPQIGTGAAQNGPGSHLSSGVRPTLQTANSFSGMPSQKSAGSDGPTSPFAMPKMQRQGSFSRIMHPGRSVGHSSLANAVQYDDNMNVIQNPGKSSKQQQQVQQSVYVPSPQGSRAPSIASNMTGNEAEGKKKKNFLKKAFT